MEKNTSSQTYAEIVTIGPPLPPLRSIPNLTLPISPPNSPPCSGQPKWGHPQTMASHNGVVAVIDCKHAER